MGDERYNVDIDWVISNYRKICSKAEYSNRNVVILTGENITRLDLLLNRLEKEGILFSLNPETYDSEKSYILDLESRDVDLVLGVQ